MEHWITETTAACNIITVLADKKNSFNASLMLSSSRTQATNTNSPKPNFHTSPSSWRFKHHAWLEMKRQYQHGTAIALVDTSTHIHSQSWPWIFQQQQQQQWKKAHAAAARHLTFIDYFFIRTFSFGFSTFQSTFGHFHTLRSPFSDTIITQFSTTSHSLLFSHALNSQLIGSFSRTFFLFNRYFFYSPWFGSQYTYNFR